MEGEIMLKRHFFYKKSRNSQTIRKNCFWVEYKECYFLISYQTVVCCVTKDGMFIKFWDNWSITTQNQINCFIIEVNKLLKSENTLNYVNCPTNSGICKSILGFNKKEWENYPHSMELSEFIDNSDDFKDFAPVFQTIPEIEWNCNEYGQSVRKIKYRG